MTNIRQGLESFMEFRSDHSKVSRKIFSKVFQSAMEISSRSPWRHLLSPLMPSKYDPFPTLHERHWALNYDESWFLSILPRSAPLIMMMTLMIYFSSLVIFERRNFLYAFRSPASKQRRNEQAPARREMKLCLKNKSDISEGGEWN